MVKRTRGAVCALTLGIGAAGCSSSDGGGGTSPMPTPTDPIPQQIAAVASEGFLRPGDAVSSHDGTTFYFTGVKPGEDGEADLAAVFSVPATGGAVTDVHVGMPLGNPTGLVMSCDNATLYVADMGQASDDEAEAPAEDERPPDAGSVFAIDVGSGAVAPLDTTGIGRPTGVALSEDCSTLYVSGWTTDGAPAVFSVGTAGGVAQTVHAGEPLVSPTGLHVDRNGVAWVMDHLAVGSDGAGVLFAIASDGSDVSPVISGLRMGTPGGVSLDSTGTTAFMPTVDEDGEGQLTAVTLATGEVRQVEAAMMRDPAGIRTARNAAIFAVVDSESNTIYAAE